MPPSQRRAILLREWQGLSYHEIADELELSQSAVETLIFRARRTPCSKLRTDGDGPSVVARIRKAFDAGALLTGLKALFEGGARSEGRRGRGRGGRRDGRGHGAAQPPRSRRTRRPSRPSRRIDREGVGGRGSRPHAHAPPGEADASEDLEEAGATPSALTRAGTRAASFRRPRPSRGGCAEKAPPGQAKQAATEPDQARGQDKPKPQNLAAEPPAQKPAEPPRAEPELRPPPGGTAAGGPRATREGRRIQEVAVSPQPRLGHNRRV